MSKKQTCSVGRFGYVGFVTLVVIIGGPVVSKYPGIWLIMLPCFFFLRNGWDGCFDGVVLGCLA